MNPNEACARCNRTMSKDHDLMYRVVGPLYGDSWIICESCWENYLPNLWLGISVTNQRDADERLPHLNGLIGWHTWISLEPLMAPVDIQGAPIEWIVVGAETGNRAGRVTPARGWIEDIGQQCRRRGVPIFEKENLAGILGRPLIQQYPKEFRHD